MDKHSSLRIKRQSLYNFDYNITRRILLISLALFFGINASMNFSINTEEQFTNLAQSFLQGELHFSGPALNNLSDMTPHNGKYYWPLGPFPAVLLMPFVFTANFIGLNFNQGYLQLLLVLGLFLIIYRLALRVGYKDEDSLFMAFGFIFSTAFIGVGLWPWSWYFAQVVTCFLVFLAVSEMLDRKRPLIIGSLFALTLATRATAALGLLWFIGETLVGNDSRSGKLKSIAIACLPCLFILALLFEYNHIRFGNIFEQGYMQQIIPPHAEAARSLGLFSLNHLPGNLYHLFLATPVPVLRGEEMPVLTFPFITNNPWGMSIFITSPCFIYLFTLKLRDKLSLIILSTVTITAIPILLYYGVGFRQFGYRYSLDFLPLLYFLLMRNYYYQKGNLSSAFKVLVLASAFLNLYIFSYYYVL